MYNRCQINPPWCVCVSVCVRVLLDSALIPPAVSCIPGTRCVPDENRMTIRATAHLWAVNTFLMLRRHILPASITKRPSVSLHNCVQSYMLFQKGNLSLKCGCSSIQANLSSCSHCLQMASVFFCGSSQQFGAAVAPSSRWISGLNLERLD